MLSYTSAELRTLSVNSHPPPRAVRKSLFTFHLWRPAHRRRRLPALEGLQHAKPSHVFNFAAVCDGLLDQLIDRLRLRSGGLMHSH